MNFPKIMGILNVTPDSFSDGGRFGNENEAIDYALKLIDEGADIIDIGGESTRPYAEFVTEEEELKRVIPIIKGIKKVNPSIKLSIDTTKYEIAKRACEIGVKIINDISGLQYEPRLAELAWEYDVELVIMHIDGIPKTMQNAPKYDDIIKELKNFFSKQIRLAESLGAKKLILDCGVGFGKTFEHNNELIKNLEIFNQFGYPQMLGISRKSFLTHYLPSDEMKNRDIATALIHSLIINKDLEIIRIHDVKLFSMLKKIYFTLI